MADDPALLALKIVVRRPPEPRKSFPTHSLRRSGVPGVRRALIDVGRPNLQLLRAKKRGNSRSTARLSSSGRTSLTGVPSKTEFVVDDLGKRTTAFGYDQFDAHYPSRHSICFLLQCHPRGH